MSCIVNFHVVRFNVSTQCIFLLLRSFIDPKICGIFVFGPLHFKCQFYYLGYVNFTKVILDKSTLETNQKLVSGEVRKLSFIIVKRK